MKHFSYINTQAGRVNVKYCEPISLKEEIAKYAKLHNIENLDKSFRDEKI